MSPSASTLQVLLQLRNQAALVIELCDAVLYAQKSLVTVSTRRLVPALRDLRSRAEIAIDAVEWEERP
jgi:hypothetical protein